MDTLVITERGRLWLLGFLPKLCKLIQAVRLGVILISADTILPLLDPPPLPPLTLGCHFGQTSPPVPDSQPPQIFSSVPIKKKIEAKSFRNPHWKKIWNQNTELNIKSPYFFPFV